MMIVTPTTATLKKYGLTLGDFAAMISNQEGKCCLCDKCPQSGQFVVDHFHVPGWKKMPPEMRRRWVRGLLCRHCNHRLVNKYMTLAAAERIVEYLGRFEERRCTMPVLFEEKRNDRVEESHDGGSVQSRRRKGTGETV